MRFVWMTLAVVALIALGVVYWYGGPQGPKLADVEHLKAPRITTLGPQKVLLVTATGDPNTVGKEAFGALMKAYFQLEGVPKGGPGFRAPRARWPLAADVPVDQWIGHYAMPVPETVASVPAASAGDGLTVELTTWAYGEVAEILHVGPYAEEDPTVRALLDFIAANGYEQAGDHEEEYLRGPGMLFAGDPDSYLTIIRYPVRKVAAPVDSVDTPADL